jgi:hypothetical protein
VVLRVGEKKRPVTLRLEPAAASPRVETPGPSATPVAAWVAAGIGVVAAGSFTYFGLKGRSTEHQLDQCAPRCNAADVSAMRREYLAADISLGILVAAAAVATYFFLSQPTGASVSAQAARSNLEIHFW